jgi:hypothetical protein
VWQWVFAPRQDDFLGGIVKQASTLMLPLEKSSHHCHNPVKRYAKTIN